LDRLLPADAVFVPEPERNGKGTRDKGMEARAGNGRPGGGGMEKRASGGSRAPDRGCAELWLNRYKKFWMYAGGNCQTAESVLEWG